MKHKLSQLHVETIVLFPKNLRFITEYSFSASQSRNIKVAMVSIVSLFLLSLIYLQGVTLWANLKHREAFYQQKAQLESEVTYWEGIATKYQGYRDVYYRIAALQYKLGNITESQHYVKKALEMDPNFPEGRVLGAQVGL